MKYIYYPKIKSRRVGGESSRTFIDKLKNGFFDKYMSGSGLDIGCKGYNDGVSILPTATAVNLEDEGYDGLHLPYPDVSQDYVHSSHVLEHIEKYKETISEWFRVLKVGGYLVVVVPHQYLYERKKELPSNWNGQHLRFYTPSSLMKEIEESLEPNSYRLRLLEDGDEDFDYELAPPAHSDGQYEITCIIQKIEKPTWDLL